MKTRTIGYIHVISGQVASWSEKHRAILIGREVALEPDLKTLRQHQYLDAQHGPTESKYGYRRVVEYP